jgi:MFS family permease
VKKTKLKEESAMSRKQAGSRMVRYQRGRATRSGAIGILITLLLGVFMGALDIFVVAPALDAIQSGLHIAPRLITWSFTAYTLVLVISQPFISKLSDRLGRRWIYVLCVLLFGAGSAICAVAPGFPVFIVGRCVQAVGAGGIIPVASAVIADVFPEGRRGMALGIVGSVWGLAFIVGPIIGSALTEGIHLGGISTDWHSIFLVNLPLAALIIVMAIRCLPAKAPGMRSRLPFDWNGAILLAMALFCIIFGLTQLDFTTLAGNITNEAAAPFVVLGIAFLVPFWLAERAAADPIVDFTAFGRKQLIVAMLLSINAGIITSSIVYLPQLVEKTLRLPSGAGGFFLVFVALTLTLGTPVVGRMIDHYGARAIMLGGGVVNIAGIGLLLSIRHSATGIIFALLLIGAGLATFVGTPLRYIVVNEAPRQRRAASLAVLTVCNSIGQTLILPLGGALISSALAGQHVFAATQSDAHTLNAIHLYYVIVLGILVLATLLAAQLKSHTHELADRKARQHRQADQRVISDTILPPQQQPALPSGELATSRR